MAATVTCPKCQAGIPKDRIVPGQAVECGNCGATLRFRPNSEPAAPPAGASTPAEDTFAPAEAGPTGAADGYDLAPDAAPPPPKPRRRPEAAGEDVPKTPARTKPRKPSPKARAAERARRKLPVVGAIVGLAALVCTIGAAVWLLGTKRNAPVAAQGGPGGAQADPVAAGHSFEVAASTKVPRNLEARLPGAIYAFRPAPPPDEPPAAKPASWPTWKRHVALDRAVVEFSDDNGVPVPIGPAPQRVTFAPGLLIPVGLKEWAIFSPDRRFAVVSSQLRPQVLQQYEDDPKVPGRRFLVPFDPDKVQPPHTLHDLANGTRAGEFPGTMPLSPVGWLSPDGEYCVTRAWDDVPDLSKTKSFVLDVWRKGQPKVEGQIAPTGCVRWAEFVAPTRLALYQQEPDAALVVWDVAARKVATRIPTTIKRPPTAQPAADWAACRPIPRGGAVAPGGRFIAVGGPLDVTVFDLEAGKEHGRFPIRGNAGIDSYGALVFLTKPDRLVARVMPNLTAWDLATGKVSHATPFGSPPGFRGTFENGSAGRLEFVMRQLVPGGNEAWPLAEPSAGRSLFFSNNQDRNGTPDDVMKKISPELVELDVLYVHQLDDKLTHRDVVPASEPFGTVPARPAVAQGHREGLKASPPRPLAAWKAPPASDWARPSPGGVLPEWPAAATDTHAAVIRYEQVEKRLRRYGKTQRYFAMFWDRYDLATGKRIGPSVPLWPWANDPTLLSDDPLAQIPTPPTTTVAALTSDGKTLALVDPNEPHRVDLWETSGKRTGFYAAREGAVVEWLGWSADGKLLALVAGVLTGWDARAATAVWETDGGYRPPVELARGGRWAALHAGSHVDLVDAATGHCLGRLRTREDIASPLAFALSPDARRLLVFTKKGQFTQSPDGAYEFYAGTLWDLTTGAAESFPFGTRLANQFNDLHDARWISPEHFAAFMTGLSVYDLRAKAMVAQFDVSEHTNGFAPQRPWYRTSPDGRVWLHIHTDQKTSSPYAWRPVPLPEQAEAVFRPDRSYEEVARQPLRVEVDFQDSTRSKRAAQSIADVLAGRGYTIGDGKWVLRVAAVRSEQYVTLSRPGLTGGELKINNIRLNWWLTPPSGGSPVWTWNQEKSPLDRSRFVKGSSLEHVAPNQTLVKTEYDFGGLDPMKALTEEYLEKASRAPEVPGNITGWALVSGDRGFALPLSGTCKIPPVK